MTYKQIIKKLESKINISDFAYEEYDSEELGLGEVKEVDQYGGEGQGDTWYSVKHFIDHNIYIKVSGLYSSYHGTDFNDFESACSNIKPIEKTVTVYE